MPYLTTGLISNKESANKNQSVRFLVEISNEDTSAVAIQIDGFFYNGSQKVKYVDDFFILAAGTVDLRNYYSSYEAFEFKFFVTSQDVAISVRGKDSAGTLTAFYPIMPIEAQSFSERL
ncbi:hypothetical protein REC12_03630 [Desulfosporosinus sp. PR]|uniref:hypothetical protein n=1 Tax=Candidatus Desulfosporosinus nitrosoreducens TaxID=3401928 RepID=UPI0027F77DBE|nr:hypothetical protein [Desulfosporosinus sp. PR]MDQ7092670.1 hypothetical protein [Desulfosporosinus sp. PR]